MEQKEKCANIISIVLYSLGDVYKLHQYLQSMEKSLDNVYTHLKDLYIVRFYLHKSIFNILYKAKQENTDDPEKVEILKKCWKILKKIICHKHSEIFIYFCNNIEIARYRSFRFNQLLENDVNISVFREADGFVSFTDCHNLKLFADVNLKKIAMIYDLGINIYDKFTLNEEFTLNEDETKDATYCIFAKFYSLWLNYYYILKNNLKLQDAYLHLNETKLCNDTFDCFDILAGTLSIKIRFKHDFVKNIITSIKNNLIKENILKKFGSEAEPDGIIKLLNIGYDEIFLKELFYNFSSFEEKTYTTEFNTIEKENTGRTNRRLRLRLKRKILNEIIKLKQESINNYSFIFITPECKKNIAEKSIYYNNSENDEYNNLQIYDENLSKSDIPNNFLSLGTKLSNIFYKPELHLDGNKKSIRRKSKRKTIRRKSKSKRKSIRRKSKRNKKNLIDKS